MLKVRSEEDLKTLVKDFNFVYDETTDLYTLKRDIYLIAMIEAKTRKIIFSWLVNNKDIEIFYDLITKGYIEKGE